MKHILYIGLLFAFFSCKSPQPRNIQQSPGTTSDQQQQPPPPPTTTTKIYNDQLQALSIDNSFDNGNVGNPEIVNVQIKNTGDDICTVSNVQVSFSRKALGYESGGVAAAGPFDGIAVKDLKPGELGNFQVTIPIDATGYYTFRLTDLWGLFEGSHSTVHFKIPDENNSASLTVTK